MNFSFIDAAYQKTPEHIPVWFMRQAGRSLPEYRALRGVGSILKTIQDPELVAEITLQPVKRYGVDAAVLYSDIMVPVVAAGINIDIHPGQGPVIEKPIRSEADLNNVGLHSIQHNLEHVTKAIDILKSELKIPLIGFAGAPFTVASYLIEGSPSKTYSRTKAVMFDMPALWTKLMEQLVDISASFIELQVRHGANAVQIFDSWAGALSPSQYERFVKPYSKALFKRLSTLHVPKIHFGVGTGELLSHMSDMDIEVLGVDWRTPLSTVSTRVGRHLALQGNLDPSILIRSTPLAILRETADTVLDAKDLSGYIFNLGHGVLPETNPDMLKIVVEFVHEYGRRIQSTQSIDPEAFKEFLP